MHEILLWLVAFFASLARVTGTADEPQTDYVGMVAAEAAYSAAMPVAGPPKPKKPIDPNCKTCKGTGKVKSGDGLGWSPCPACQADDMPASAQKASSLPGLIK